MKVLVPVVAGLVMLWGCGSCRDRSAQAQAREHSEGDHGDEHQDGKEAGDAGHHDEVSLTPEAVRSADVQLGEARKKDVSGELRASARLALTQRGSARVTARVQGRVASLEVQLGEKVRAGQVLGYVESPELGQTRAGYLAAATKARVAGANYQRERELVAKGISAERDMREAESVFVSAQAEKNAAEAALHALGLSEAEIRSLKADEHYSSRFPMRSPIDGTVLAIDGTVGQSIEGTAPLFTVGNLDELWALLDIFEAQLASIHVGQPVELTVGAVPGTVFRGRVDYIGDLVDERSRTIPVRVVVPNPDARLKPGMFATARLSTGVEPDAGTESGVVVVPREAVQKVGDEQVVFVPDGENRFRAVEVEVGETTAEEVEIRSGLQPGTAVVTRGAFILKSELSKESMGEGHSH